MMSLEGSRRLEVEAGLDPGNLIRVLHFFQARNVTPVRVHAHCVDADDYGTSWRGKVR